MIDIPLRPSDYDGIKIGKADADCLTYVCLTGCKHEDAFKLWHPEYLTPTGQLNQTGKQMSKQFFSYARHREYMDLLKAEIEEYCNRGLKKSDPKTKDPDIAAQTYRDKVYDAIDAVDASDIDAMKTVGDLGKTVKIFKEDEQQQEQPRRYIPLRCSECPVSKGCEKCEYKLFIEEHIKLGNIERINN